MNYDSKTPSYQFAIVACDQILLNFHEMLCIVEHAEVMVKYLKISIPYRAVFRHNTSYG